ERGEDDALEATTAQTLADLILERDRVKELQAMARSILDRGSESKFSRLLEAMKNPRFRDEKILIFTEHRDTANYLTDRLEALGFTGQVAQLHGAMDYVERDRQVEFFRQPISEGGAKYLIATDAAGEGVNLQNANLMVNYDLPWNPNRLEQRFGRIHRIGQTEVCHLWNLVAKETREGDVYHRLLKKLEVESEALKGRVFDILGEVFEDRSLKDLLMDAVRYGDQPEVRARLSQKVDAALDHDHLKSLLNRNALSQEVMSPERLFAVKEEMEKAEARRLQPYFVRASFSQAFNALGGAMHAREAGRYEITHVPVSIRERDRRITGRKRRDQEPVFKKSERICFEREAIQPLDRPGLR
ncbi:helicase-related protein, partial [Vibrio parahaemolyticus]|nr:helicase-related protein [Vibrio parahaemolyticus]